MPAGGGCACSMSGFWKPPLSAGMGIWAASVGMRGESVLWTLSLEEGVWREYWEYWERRSRSVGFCSSGCGEW